MRARVIFIFLVIILASCLVPGPGQESEMAATPPVPISQGIPHAVINDALAQPFTENMGQIEDAGLLFYSQAGGVAFTSDSVLLHSEQETPGGLHNVVRLTFIGANDIAPTGHEPTQWRSNHFLGSDRANWHTGVANYRAVVYRNLWNGIDLMCRGAGGGVKYDFVLHPGADHNDIKVGVEGHESLSLGDGGSLVIGTGLGPGTEIIDSGLDVFYADDPSEKLHADFVLLDRETYSFSIRDRDMARATVIDPVVYSTYLGGSGMDSATSVAVDSKGCAYVTGHTDSVRFTTGAGTFRADPDNDQDVFVFKLAQDGSSIIYAAFMGGKDYDAGHAIAVDAGGCAHVTGVTFSEDFSVTEGAIDRTYGGVGDAFVSKLSQSGDSLAYSTYLGGRHDDVGNGIALDRSGRAHVAGHTWSSDFPATQGAYRNTSSGDVDAFVTKLSDTGDYMVYSTYLGGPGSDRAASIALDQEGNAYVTGTASTGFPATVGALNLTGGGINVFVTKFGGSGNALAYSAVFGGSGTDLAGGIAVDSQGCAHVVGDTDSGDYPAAGIRRYGRDIFVSKLDLSGDSFLYSSYIGGSRDDCAGGISIDSDGRAFVTGHTDSADFPTTTGALFRQPGGGLDGFVSMLDSSGSVGYSSYLGGSADDSCLAVSVSATGCAFVAGDTQSSDFPTVPMAPWPSISGGSDGFLAKMDITAPVAEAGLDRMVNESTVVELNGTASADNEAIVNSTWTFNDGLADVTLHGLSQAHKFAVPGEYNVSLKVMDAVGNIDTDSMRLTVLLYPLPIADAGQDIVVEENAAALLNGSASRDNTGISGHVWTFHDGMNEASTSGPTPTWLFNSPGAYSVTLNVTDEDGNWDADTLNVTVLDVTPPEAVLTPAIAAAVGIPVNLDGSGSVDAVGVVNYTWTFTHNNTEMSLYGPNQSFVFWGAGEHAVVLTVSDAAGNQASNSMLVTVTGSGDKGGIGAMGYFSIFLLTISIILLFTSILRYRKRNRPGNPGRSEVEDE
ncbi:MAG: PKD domain-containing protein [Thermoplasmata archaeon]